MKTFTNGGHSLVLCQISWARLGRTETRPKDLLLYTARSAEVDPPRTWAPSVGSRVRGCVILEYINSGQQ